MYNETPQNLIVIEGRATYERIQSVIREIGYEEALRQIENFIKVYPDFAQAHNDLGVIYYQQGNSLKSLAHHEKAHKLDPSNITFRKNLADFYFVELGWTDDAIHTYLGILRDNPFDIETLNALGAISLSSGRNEQARQYYSRSLQLDSLNSDARQALLLLGGSDTAGPSSLLSHTSLASAPAAAQIRQSPPETPEMLHQQAIKQVEAGNINQAIQLFEQSLRLYPEYAPACNDLGVIYQQHGDLQKSRQFHEEAVRLQPTSLVFQKNLADLLSVGLHEYEDALRIYVNLLSTAPRDVEILKAIANISLEIGKHEDARAFLKLILGIQPWNIDARESLSILEQQLRQFTNSPTTHTAEELFAKAQQLSRAERFGDARIVLEELVQLYPDHAVSYNDIGAVSHRMGDVKAAQEAYEKAVKLQPNNPLFQKNLADLYFAELRRTDDAIFIYLELYRKNPRDVETLAALGHISKVVGRPEEAKSFYRCALEIEPWNSDIRAMLQTLF